MENDDIFEINLDDYEKKFHKKRSNGLLLSDEEINILERYDIDYLSCRTLNELLFQITSVINTSFDDIEELEELAIKIGEDNYYQNTNK